MEPRCAQDGTTEDQEQLSQVLQATTTHGGKQLDDSGVPIIKAQTRIVHLEEDLQACEARFRVLLEDAHGPICLKNNDLEYTHANTLMLNLLGLRMEQFRGSRDDHIFPPEEAAIMQEMDLLALQGAEVSHRYPITAGGVTLTLNWSRIPVHTSSGKRVGILVMGSESAATPCTDPRPDRDCSELRSQAMEKTCREIQLAAKTDSIVLFLGETGSGKDYWARRLHEMSARSCRPYLSVNCSALAPQLIESELFGHEPGAFTGAVKRKRGIVELTDGGTLLLNEIGELPQEVQAKLLTFLDTRSFIRTGGERSVSVDVRILAATNRDLSHEVSAGTFRQDLYYRLNVFSLSIPPLRERAEDIPIIVEDLLEALARRMGLPSKPIVDLDALRLLVRHSWPGNVRQLANVLERALIVGDGTRISSTDLSIPRDDEAEHGIQCADGTFSFRLGGGLTMPDVLREAKMWMVRQALEMNGAQLDEAAHFLGVSRDSLKHYMKSLGIRRSVRASSHE